jgi:type VI secretion system secreted protein VgrG
MCKPLILLVNVGFVALFGASAGWAQPVLGSAQSFSVLGASTVTNTGSTLVTGGLGVSPGSAVTGFPPGMVIGGSIHAGDSVALQAQTDLTAAYTTAAATPCTADLTGQDLGGLTLTPGVYCFNSSAQLTGTLTLNAQGNPGAVFLFKTGSSLTTASNSAVLLTNGASPCNVTWQVGSSATFGTGTVFAGNILALTSITLNTGARVSGRALARTGAVTLDTSNVAGCAGAITAVPTLSGSGMLLLAALLALFGAAAARRRMTRSAT